MPESPWRRRGAPALLAALTAVAALGLGRLRFDDEYRRIFRSSDPAYDRLQEVAATFGADEDELALVVEGPVGSPKARRGLTALRHRLGGIEGVTGVLGPIPGEDSSSAVLVTRLDPSDRRLAELDGTLEEVRGAARDALEGTELELHRTGLPAMRSEIVSGMHRDQALFSLGGMGLGALVGWLLLRRVSLLMVLGSGPLAGVLWTLGAMGWLGLKLDVLTNVVPTLVLVVGLTDSLHVLHHVRRARREGFDRRAAAALGARRALLPCTLTSLTTAVGFASLGVSRLGILRDFGLACSAGVLLNLVAVLTVVPLLAATRWGEALGGVPADLHMGRIVAAAGRITGSMLRARTVAAGGVLAFAALVATSARLEPDYRYREYLPAGSEALAGLEVLDRTFGGSLPVHALVEWAPEVEEPAARAAVGEVHEALADHAVTGATLAPAPWPAPGLLGGPPSGEESRRWRPERRQALVTTRVPGLGAARLEPVFGELEEALARVERTRPGVRVELTGLAVVASRSSLPMIGELFRSLGLAAAGIFVLLSVGLGSLRLGLLSLVPNLLPLAATGALLELTGRPLQYTSVTVFAICLGIAVDDTVHLLVAYRRERDSGRPKGPAIRRALSAVGPALLATTALLTAGLGPVGLSGLPLVRLFGLLCVFAFLVALVSDLVLLPAMLLAFGRRGPEPSSRGPSPSTGWTEDVAPEEEERLERFAATIHAVQEENARRSGRGVRRAFHAKTHLAAEAVLRVRSDLPEPARHGLFRHPGEHRAWVRLSNGNGLALPDFLPDSRGLAVKVAWPHDTAPVGPPCQDFLAMNLPRQPAGDIEHFMALVEAARSPLLAPIRLVQALGWRRATADTAFVLLRLGRPVRSVATLTYWSGVPIRCGPYAVKYRFRPVPGEPARGGLPGAGHLRRDLARRLAAGDLVFGLELQFYVDPEHTPIENAAVEWPEAVAPWVPVADLVIRRRDLSASGSRAGERAAEALTFSPWNAAEEHRPLGGLMRARRTLYAASVSRRAAPYITP